jgi:hypothetical protein
VTTLQFGVPAVSPIESTLATERPGGWRRARPAELDGLAQLGFTAAWRVDMPKAWHVHPAVDHVLVGIDAAFPWSEPRAVAPQAVQRGVAPWPHVESQGVLCLKTTRYSAAPGARVMTVLQDVLELLQMDARLRLAEFQREIYAYWSHHATRGAPDGSSLVDLHGPDRELVFWRPSSTRIVFADDGERLSAWLNHSGFKVPDSFPTTTLTWLPSVPAPDQFPVEGDDVMRLIGRERIEPHLRAGEGLPLLLGCEVGGARVLIGVELHGASQKTLARGFRPSSPRPQHLLADAFRKLPIGRFVVDRADPAWVHGRDRNPTLSTLRTKSVAVIGCGAMGGYLARAIAQAGVGSLLLVDHDSLSPANTGRHLLGMSAVGRNKAAAVAQAIRADFPSIASVQHEPKRFQGLSSETLAALEACDAIVLAGIDLQGEIAVDQWRQALADPPTLVWTWIEEFALAGHAVALLGGDRLIDGLDADGYFRGRLTRNWPSGAATALEAGCSTAFQPYANVDLMGTVTLATRMVLDTLTGRIRSTTLRSWLGDRGQAVRRGCEVSNSFGRSYCEQDGVWPP